ncbi:MAG: XRE family transcriptional regulator [Casimicrobiaceae bacterium]
MRSKSKEAGKAPEPSATAPEVGHMLQSLRLARNYSLDELARSSGVSKSVLSQIERDRTNPTLGTLWRLAQALGVEIGDLLRTQTIPAGISILDEHNTPVLLSSDRRCTIRILGPIELTGRVEWYEMRFEARGALVSEAHEPGTTEHLTVLEGQLEVESGRRSDRALLGLGQTARYPADQPHAIRNPFAHRAVAIVIVTSGMIVADAGRQARPALRQARRPR